MTLCGGKTNDLGDGTQDSTTSGDSGTTSDGPTGDTTPPPFVAPTTDGIPPGDGPLPDVPVGNLVRKKPRAST